MSTIGSSSDATVFTANTRADGAGSA
jgi:hypothetical protein